jgi:hypothetical protein
MLAADGYTIVHMSRHCGLELGKDIIAISPDGTPCAYQLKTARGGKVTYKQWQDDIAPQVADLVEGAIDHPSVLSGKHHRSFLVTNGELQEEVSTAIQNRNRAWSRRRGCKLKLETIVRGQMLAMAKKLQTDLWPTEVHDVRTLLELHLADGVGALPREKLASLLESTFHLGTGQHQGLPTRAETCRLLASGALLCSVAINGFSASGNHAAEIEAWVLYVSHMLAVAERMNLSATVWQQELEIAEHCLFNSLGELCEELRERKHYVEGDPFSDLGFYQVRTTYLLALMSAYGLWKLLRGERDDDEFGFVSRFCRDCKGKLYLWGEAVIPQFLALYWLLKKVDATCGPDEFLRTTLGNVCASNAPGSKCPLPNPYYDGGDVMEHLYNLSEQPYEETFTTDSYTMEGLVHLYARLNWKQAMRAVWPSVTRIAMQRFFPLRKWHFYRWRNREGTHVSALPKHTQQWGELKRVAAEAEGKCLPRLIKRYPVLLLLYLIVCPHRFNAEVARWLDTHLQEI